MNEQGEIVTKPVIDPEVISARLDRYCGLQIDDARMTPVPMPNVRGYTDADFAAALHEIAVRCSPETATLACAVFRALDTAGGITHELAGVGLGVAVGADGVYLVERFDGVKAA